MHVRIPAGKQGGCVSVYKRGGARRSVSESARACAVDWAGSARALSEPEACGGRRSNTGSPSPPNPTPSPWTSAQ
eukprot:666455-Rhodomonas_salina.1